MFLKILISFFIVLYFPAALFGQVNEMVLNISHLTGDFFIYSTYKSFNGIPFSANGMYLLTEDGVVLFDTPWDTTQFQPLIDSIKLKHQKDVILCIATHSHEDRTGGFDFLKGKGVRTFTSKQTDEICIENKEKRAEFHFNNDTTFMIGQHKFQTYYGGEGHTKDNIIIWFDKEKILYGGCLIKSTEATDLGNIEEANLKEWPNTIKNIKRRFGYPQYVIPGHQNWINNASLDHTLKLLSQHKK